MNIKNWLISKLLSHKVRKIKEISPLEKNVDLLMSDEMKGIAQTNRTIDKLLKVRLLREESQHTLDKLSQLGEDLNPEYDDEDENEGIEDELKKMLFQKVLGAAVGVIPDKFPQETEGFNGDPLAVAPVDPTTPQKNPLLDAIGSASPKQINAIKRKFLG